MIGMGKHYPVNDLFVHNLIKDTDNTGIRVNHVATEAAPKHYASSTMNNSQNLILRIFDRQDVERILFHQI